MKNNNRQGTNKNMDQVTKKGKGSAQKDGIRYDYTDSSDFKEDK